MSISYIVIWTAVTMFVLVQLGVFNKPKRKRRKK